MNLREQVLEEAKAAVLKSRNVDYGDPEDNFKIIADFFDIYLKAIKRDIRPHDISVFCIFIKISRIIGNPTKLDHWIDTAGYAACGYECTANLSSKIPESPQSMSFPPGTIIPVESAMDFSKFPPINSPPQSNQSVGFYSEYKRKDELSGQYNPKKEEIIIDSSVTDLLGNSTEKLKEKEINLGKNTQTISPNPLYSGYRKREDDKR